MRSSLSRAGEQGGVAGVESRRAFGAVSHVGPPHFPKDFPRSIQAKGTVAALPTCSDVIASVGGCASARLALPRVRFASTGELEAGERSPTFETWDRMCVLYGWPQTFVGATANSRGEADRSRDVRCWSW